MDTSESYIKMCEKAEEIQELLNTNNLHLIGAPADQHGIIIGIRSHDIVDRVWLPRQDQLQAMIGEDWKEVFERFAESVGGNPFNYTDEEMSPYELSGTEFTSMEQLWLAFVMKQKYGKMWDGEEWKR